MRFLSGVLSRCRGAVAVSVVIPCLNEADSIGQCVTAALRVLDEHGLDGEVVVVDNGSDDGSGVLARWPAPGSSTSRGAATAAPTSRASRRREATTS